MALIHDLRLVEVINWAQWKRQIATICLDRWQRIFRVNKTLSIITVKRRASRLQITPRLQPEDVPLMKTGTHMSCVHNLAICVKSEWVRRRCARGSSCLSENAAETQSPFFSPSLSFFNRLWGSSFSSLTLISAALVHRWSDEAFAWMNNAGTPANKRRHPLTPFHGASPYARVPRAFKLPPSLPPFGKKKERKEKTKSRWQQKAT